jgi:hypothetical protein
VDRLQRFSFLCQTADVAAPLRILSSGQPKQPLGEVGGARRTRRREHSARLSQTQRDGYGFRASMYTVCATRTGSVWSISRNTE